MAVHLRYSPPRRSGSLPIGIYFDSYIFCRAVKRPISKGFQGTFTPLAPHSVILATYPAARRRYCSWNGYGLTDSVTTRAVEIGPICSSRGLRCYVCLDKKKLRCKCPFRELNTLSFAYCCIISKQRSRGTDQRFHPNFLRLHSDK